MGGFDKFQEHIFGIDHSSDKHGAPIKVNCPICANRPGGSSTYMSVNIYGHWKVSHGLHNANDQDENLRWYCPD